MQRVRLSSELSLSRIVHGMWRLNEWNYTKEELNGFIHKLLERGITTFDHADIYGGYTCEGLFGEALAMEPGLRESMEIVTKVGIKFPHPNRPEQEYHSYDLTYDHIMKSVERSLTNFHTDYIDLLLVHRPSMLMDVDEIARAFSELKESGKVREFGVSNFTDDYYSLLQNRCNFKLVTNQIEVSPLKLHHFYDSTINSMYEKNVHMMIWSPLAGGDIFTSNDEKAVNLRKVLDKYATKYNVSPDTIVYAWILKHPSIMLPIVGSGKLDRIDAAINATHISITNDEWFAIYQAGLGHDIP